MCDDEEPPQARSISCKACDMLFCVFELVPHGPPAADDPLHMQNSRFEIFLGDIVFVCP